MKRSFIREEYGLTGSPFTSIIGVESELEAWVNRQEEVKRWNLVLDKASKTPNSNFIVFIIGDYGMGKTLSLHYITHESKQRAMYQVYLNFLSEQKPRNPGLDFLLRILKVVNLNDVKITKRDIDVLRAAFPEVAQTVYNIFFGVEDEKKLATAFIKGEVKPTLSQLKLMGLLRKIDDVEIAKEYLIGVLYLLKISGFITLVVAVDEFEYLFSLVTRSNQSIYIALLRGLFDLPNIVPKELQGKIANIAFFIGISEDGIRRLEDIAKTEESVGGPTIPLRRRITDRIRLGTLTKKYARELIQKRLSLDRIEGKYRNQPLIPFKEDFVEYIYKLTNGRPSEIIVRSDHVLDKGLEQRVPRLTADFAKEVFKERGFTY